MSEKEINFVGHLTELRQRLIHSIIFLAILFVCCYIFSDSIYGFLVEPYANAVKNDGTERRLIFTALQETFLTYLKKFHFLPLFLGLVLLYLFKYGNLLLPVYTSMKKSNYALSHFNTNFVLIRWDVSLLFNNATRYKVFSFF